MALHLPGPYRHTERAWADSWSADEQTLLCRGEYTGVVDSDLRPQALYLLNVPARAIYRVAVSPLHRAGQAGLDGPGLAYSWDQQRKNIWWTLKQPQQALKLYQWQVAAKKYRRHKLVSAHEALIPGYFLPGALEQPLRGPVLVLSDLDYEHFFRVQMGKQPYRLEVVKGELPLTTWRAPQSDFIQGTSLELSLKGQPSRWRHSFSQTTEAAQSPTQPEQVLTVTTQLGSSCILQIQALSTHDNSTIWRRHFRFPVSTCQAHTLRWYRGSSLLLIESEAVFALDIQTQVLQKIVDLPSGYKTVDALFSPSQQHIAYTLQGNTEQATQIVVLSRAYFEHHLKANGLNQ